MSPSALLDHCDTLMLDMDGTLLDLAFDNFMWQELIPEAYARQRGMSATLAQAEIAQKCQSVLGTLNWYCMDHWSEILGIDVAELHREKLDRVRFLPRAREFLEEVSRRPLRLLLVTNSHPATLALKAEATGIASFFDGIWMSHEVGHAKEEKAFWHKLREAERFDPARTLFVDDTERVLASARAFGIRHLLAVTRPDTTAPVRCCKGFAGIEGVADLLPLAGRCRR